MRGGYMFSVADNNVITITRGDTATTAIYINQGTNLDPEQYVLQSGDVIYIGVMEYGQLFEDAIIKYRLDESDLNDAGNAVWKIKATDTEYLDEGKYFYEIKLARDNGELVDTIVSKTELYIQD